MNKPLIEVILSYFKYKQRINIIKCSKKVQEYFQVGLNDYIGLNTVSCFYKKFGMSLQNIDDDNELLYHNITSCPQFKEDNNEIKVRNMLYHQQLAHCNIDFNVINQQILFNNNNYSFNCVFYDEGCKLLFAGTDKGELFTSKLGSSESKWNIINNFHEGKISKIIQLKKSDIAFDNNKHYASCSIRRGEISIWTINNIGNDVNQLIKVNDFGPAVFTVIEYKPNLLALGTKHGVFFYNIKTQQNTFIDHYTSSTYSLLEMGEYKHRIIVGSNKCAIIDTKYNDYNDPETLISVTTGALAVRSIIKVNEMIIIAEDDHLKFCEFSLNYDNPRVDRDTNGLNADCKSRIIKLNKKKGEFISNSNDKGKNDSYVEAQVLQRKHIIPILKIEALVDKGFIVSCTEDNNIMFWNLNNKSIDFMIASGHIKNITDFCMITNNEGFITVGKDGKIILINNYMECYYDQYFNRYNENNSNNNTYYNCVKLQSINEYSHSY